MGLAGSLLVFTGVWHIFEWLMGGRNKDTLILIPFGAVYAFLGYLIVTFQGGSIPAIAALLLTSVGAVAAFSTRRGSQVRAWVLWAFIVFDVIIVAAIVAALLLG